MREVTIINRHTYITRIVKDDVVLFEAAVSEESSNYVDKSLLNVKDILEFANTVNIDDVREVLKRQIEMNSAIADEGLMTLTAHRLGGHCCKCMVTMSRFVPKRGRQPVLMQNGWLFHAGCHQFRKW